MGEPLRVCIVGGGAAGLACAWSLSRLPNKFKVDLYEKNAKPGGQASSFTLPPSISGGDNPNAEPLFINDGVQGGAPSYRNTIRWFKEFGFEMAPVKFTVSFGKGDTFWSNHRAPSSLVQSLASRGEVARFGRLLRLIARLEPVFAFLPIQLVLKVARFSDEFCERMVYPLTALFFGTGNQTPRVSSAIISRVFLDPQLRLFDYDDERLLKGEPDMFAFPKLECGATIHSDCAVVSVVRHSNSVTITDVRGRVSEYDKVVFACDAETALKILDEPTWLERKVLGNVRYYDDVTVTHTDGAYMRKYYEVNERDDKDQYFVYTYPHDPGRIEMSFNLSNYQPQFKSGQKSDQSKKKVTVYQTIFLNAKHSDEWTINEIDQSKVLLVKWWRQFAHTWTHFAFTVPWIQFLQGRKNTLYTLFNTHEMAVVSGLAAAHQLGARPYPFADDDLARQQFNQYLTLAHGVLRQKNKG
eukprot:jgi/Chlat1/5907/Chrsp4S09095